MTIHNNVVDYVHLRIESHPTDSQSLQRRARVCKISMRTKGLNLIKAFRLQDTFLVKKLQKQGIALDMEERLLHPRSPLLATLFANLFPATPGVTTYLLSNGKRAHSLVQARVRPGRPEQEVIFLSPTLTHGNGASAIWQRLLNHLCVEGGRQGYQRIYARLKKDSDEAKIFKLVGFLPYAEEQIFRLDESRVLPQARSTLGIRRQTPADSWSLQRLYTAVTPQAVQVAEGLAQGQWQIHNYLLADQGHRYGYVWENEGEILAVLNIHSGKNGHWFRVMIHPSAHDKIANLCADGLNILPNPKNKPIYCSFRTYQSELAAQISEHGFKPFAQQQIMVKHNTVRARDLFSQFLPTFERGVEAKHASPMMKSSAQKTEGTS